MQILDLGISDELLGTFVPIAVYWIYSGIYVVLGSFAENYRLHSKQDEDEKNSVSKGAVIKGVLFQQALQAVVATLLFAVGGSDNQNTASQNASLLVSARQFVTAMLVMDTWQYFMHRYMHQNKFLYKHIHSLHHRLIVPYSFGALYNHPLEGLLNDTVGGALSFLVSGMSPRASIYLGTSSIYSSKTTLLTMMYTINSMATSTTSHSHSLLCGIESWVPTCHTHWRRGQEEVLKLDLAKITRMSNIFLDEAFLCVLLVLFFLVMSSTARVIMSVYTYDVSYSIFFPPFCPYTR